MGPSPAGLATLAAALTLAWVTPVPPSQTAQPLGDLVREAHSGVATAVGAQEAALAPGDVIFRRGTSAVSRLVLSLDQRSEFSHVGLIARVGGRVLVVHAEPESIAAIPGGSRVKADPLDQFLARATSVAVYRLAEASATVPDRAASVALDYAARGVPFDTKFDLTTSESLYCTELVWRAYGEAGVELLDGELTSVGVPGIGRVSILLPSTLQSSSKLRPVGRFGEETQR